MYINRTMQFGNHTVRTYILWPYRTEWACSIGVSSNKYRMKIFCALHIPRNFIHLSVTYCYMNNEPIAEFSITLYQLRSITSCSNYSRFICTVCWANRPILRNAIVKFYKHSYVQFTNSIPWIFSNYLENNHRHLPLSIIDLSAWCSHAFR